MNKPDRFMLCVIFIFNVITIIGQTKSIPIFQNLKHAEIGNKKGLVWYDKEGFMRVNYSENFKSTNNIEPIDITREYFTRNQKKLGLTNELSNIHLVNQLKTEKNHTLYFQQKFNGIPVFDSQIIVLIDSQNVIKYIWNNAKSFAKIEAIRSSINVTQNEATALAYKGCGLEKAVNNIIISKEYVLLRNDILQLCWRVELPGWLLYINCDDGSIISKSNTVLGINLQTKIYKTNPIDQAEVYYGYSGFKDDDDNANAELNSELTNVTIENIRNGWTFESYANDYCQIYDFSSPMVAYSHKLDNEYVWFESMDRDNDLFEVAMVLYHIQEAGDWINELGYMEYPVTKILDIDPHGSYAGLTMGAWTLLGQNSSIRFGTGGVDAAEDAFIIWHEYMHYLNYALHQDRNAFLSYIDKHTTGSSMEGVADYFAASYKIANSNFDWYSVGEWGMAEYWILHPERIRRTDRSYLYPDNYQINDNETHYNGQILSAPLLEIRNIIGRERADKILLESIKLWPANTDILTAGELYILAAEALYGKENLCDCITQLSFHGLTQRPYSQNTELLYNQIINSEEHYNDICSIRVKEVVIQSNAAVIFEPISGETTIESSFETKLGSTFEIK